MPRDSGGTHNLVPGYLAVTGQPIEASQHNPVLEDISASLTGSLPRNGSAPMGANLPMAGFKVTGMADGTAATDAVTKGQLDGVASVESSINGATVKTALADNDRFVLTDSEASYAVRRTPWSAIKDALTSVFALRNITVTGAGLATGGGALTGNQVVTVTAATQAEAEAGTLQTVVMTPLRSKQAVDAAITAAVSPTTAPSGSWVNAPRTPSTTYTNSFNKDIAVRTTGGTSTLVPVTMQISPDGTEWMTLTEGTIGAGASNNALYVPKGWRYRFLTIATGYGFSEYR